MRQPLMHPRQLMGSQMLQRSPQKQESRRRNLEVTLVAQQSRTPKMRRQ